MDVGAALEVSVALDLRIRGRLVANDANDCVFGVLGELANPLVLLEVFTSVYCLLRNGTEMLTRHLLRGLLKRQ